MQFHPDRRPVFEALDALSEGEWQDVLQTLQKQTEALRLVINDPTLDALMRAIANAQKR